MRSARPSLRPVHAALAVAIALQATAPGTAGAVDPVAPEHYAFSARVTMVPAPGLDRFTYSGQAVGLPVGRGEVEVARQAASAVAVAAARMFQPDDGTGEPLLLEVEVIGAELSGGGAAGRAQVAFAVTVREQAGRVVGRWPVRAEEAIAGFDARAVSGAFARAATSAAAEFENAFDRSPEVGGWLAERGLARRRPPKAPERFHERPSRVLAVDVGAGVVGGQPGLALRAGISGERFLAGVAVTHAGASFPAGATFGGPLGPVQFSPLTVGVDAGVLQRFLRAFEIRGGLGIHAVGGTATLQYVLADPSVVQVHSTEKWVLGGSAFLGVVGALAPWTSLGLRLRAGLEGRITFGGGVTFDAYGASIRVPGASALLLLGAELPGP